MQQDRMNDDLGYEENPKENDDDFIIYLVNKFLHVTIVFASGICLGWLLFGNSEHLVIDKARLDRDAKLYHIDRGFWMDPKRIIQIVDADHVLLGWRIEDKGQVNILKYQNVNIKD